MVMDVSGFSLSQVGVGRAHLREACRTKVDRYSAPRHELPNVLIIVKNA